MGAGETNGVEPGMKDDPEKHGMTLHSSSILGLHHYLATATERQTTEDNGEILASVVHLLTWCGITVESRLTDTPQQRTPTI